MTTEKLAVPAEKLAVPAEKLLAVPAEKLVAPAEKLATDPMMERGYFVAEMKQACATIRQAMVQINELSATMSAQNFNQMTRWVNTKEEHATKIMNLIADYCLAQRCKVFGTAGSPFASEGDYVDALKVE